MTCFQRSLNCTAAGEAGCFLLYKNKQKIKGISKIQHINIRTKKRAKKGAEKEPNRNGKERLKNKEKMLS